MLKQFIDQLSTNMGFQQPLEANEDGSYSLRLDPDLDITLKESGDNAILFHTQLAELPARNREDFLLKTMVANLLGRETGGAALGLDREGKKLVLVDFLSDHQDYRAFHERLEEFANYAEVWREETREFVEQQQDAEE